MAEREGFEFFALAILFFGSEHKQNRLAVQKITHFHVTPLQNSALLLACRTRVIFGRKI
jgi:hypothetical protein